jgi:hypothetical protein
MSICVFLNVVLLNKYSLLPILLFTNMDVSITKMCLDTSILAKSNMSQREYIELDYIASLDYFIWRYFSVSWNAHMFLTIIYVDV